MYIFLVVSKCSISVQNLISVINIIYAFSFIAKNFTYFCRSVFCVSHAHAIGKYLFSNVLKGLFVTC